ncbi:DUF4430 domain-containing protein [Collinsella aerofaciens]|uniref:DUF4430 domain-containing protein n=1 Tax=Collinsella aerofaciens TaxID=74426 RepID=UPI00319DC2EF
MGVLERNMRDDVGQPLGNAPSADSRRQMDMFEDDRQRASWRRHGAIARGVAKRGLVAFLAFVMAFGTTPAQLWAEGAEGIAEAVAQAATSGEGAAADDGVTSDADVTAADDAAENVAIGDDATAGDTASAEGSAAPASVDSEQGDASDSVAAASARSAYVAVDSVEIVDADGNGLAYGSGTAKVGDTVKVAAYYYDEYAYEDEEISSSEYAQLGYQWYVGNSRSAAPAASTFTALEGATARELKLTSDLTGKYVACRVTYGDGAGDYEFTASLKNPVEALAEPEAPKSDEAKKLDEAVAKLKADGYSGWYPNPSQGSDANICSMLSAKLANLGYSDIKVSLAGVTYGGRDPKQDGGIADDGKISYFFLSPADKTSALDYSLLRQFTPTYTLTLGSERVSYTPGRASTLAWDGGKVVAYLKAAWAHVEGLPDEIEADVSQGTLPSSISINGVKVASISWMSLNGSVAKVNSGYGDPTVTYTHGMTDQTAQLTATLSLAVPGYNNAPSNGTAYLVSYTVKAKTQEQIDAEKDELSAALDRIVLKDFESEKEIDANAVEGDIQLPNTRRSGIDAPSGAKLSYASSNETVAKINGYRVVITRDIEGATNDAVITATLAKDGITVTRDIAIKVKPIADSEIDQAAAFMQQVKDAYAKSLLGANASVDAITENLSTFAEAVPTADGGIEYRKGKDSKQSGVVTADLPGYDAMSGNDWRTYRTSDTAVISNENLKVTRPEADTLVTVESNLTYAKYESLAKAHPENAKLQSLVNQSVKATYRVVGTVDHSDPKISVGFKLVGVDADGNDEVWADSTKSVVYGSTAGDVIEDALKGMTHTATGVGTADYYLSDITSADGRKLGWDASTGKYWQLFVNGKASEVGAGQVRLAPGDSVVLYYSAFGASPDDANKATVKASVSFIGPDENGGNSVWAFAGDVKMSDGSTAADLTEQELKAAGLTYDSQDTSGASFYLASITRNGKTYGSDQSTGRYWQLYVNGEYSQKMAGQITLKPGDKVQWVYAADNEKPLEGLIVNPFASRPDWTASWNGFGNAGGTTLVNTPTPTESAAELWKVNLATAADKWVSLGDPIIAGGYVFVTTNSELVKIDNTGKVVARVSKGGTTSYFSRPVYADGLIISANDDGSVCAFSAETLECVWKTSALETPAAGGRYQANSTMTVANGCVYAEFVTGAGASGTAAGGAMVCIDIATGKLVWSEVTTKTGSSTGEGYYWAGAAASGSDLVIGDESGCVKLIDGKSGKVKSSVSLSGNPVRATIVSAGTEGGNPVFLAIGRQPATLYKIVREGDALRLAGSCEFAKVSTSTPAVANGKVYVGGSDSSNNGQFTVVDLASMKVEKTLDMGKKAEVKASPIASVQGSDVYVYFTCNKTPGAVYCFNQSTGEAVEIYTPSGSNANYCTASVIADVQGNLYYTNDSGTLFALKAAPGYTVAFDTRGGSTVPSAMTAQNKTMVAPANPERSGYTFAGWYKDVDCTQAWDFSEDVVTADMTLYAKWTKNAVNPGGNGGSGSNGGSGNAGAGSGSGSGTNGQQSGGAVAPGQTPVSTTTTTETKDGKDSKKDSDKSDKKSDKKDGKSDKSDAGSSAATAAKKSTAAPAQESGFNPLAIVGVAAGVIGLAVIGVFVLTKRR